MPALTEQEQEAVNAVVAAKNSEYGATAVKLELEAQLNRHQAEAFTLPNEVTTEPERRECYDCDGEGNEYCDYCDGDGVDCDDDDCEECDATGRQECETCEGLGTLPGEDAPDNDNRYSFGSEAHCTLWLLHHMQAAGIDVSDRTPLHGGYKFNSGPLSFMRFYRDGSVDSEMTFTVRLDEASNVLFVPKVVQIWKDFMAAIDQGVDVRGAGMHMAWLNSSDFSYPTGSGDSEFNTRFNNFRKSMGLLLPALYFLGASSEVTRRMGYRRPMIGPEKPSAIHIVGTALEYRVFDTCYERINQTLDNIIVMAKTLKYFSFEYQATGMSRITRQINFGNDADDTLRRLYMTNTHLDLLNAGLTKLKPKYLTVKQIKEQRKFDLTKRTLVLEEQRVTDEANVSYREYTERYDWNADVQRQYVRADLMEALSMRTTDMTTLDREAAMAEIESQINDRLRGRIAERNTIEQYVRQRIDTWRNNINRNDWQLTA